MLNFNKIRHSEQIHYLWGWKTTKDLTCDKNNIRKKSKIKKRAVSDTTGASRYENNVMNTELELDDSSLGQDLQNGRLVKNLETT
jgi:hypothetical protein